MTQYLDDPFLWNYLGAVQPVSSTDWVDINKIQPKSGDMLFRFTFVGIDWGKPINSYLWTRINFLTSAPPFYSSPIKKLYLQPTPIIIDLPAAKWFDASQKDLRIEVQKKFFRKVYRYPNWWPDQNWGVRIDQLVV